MRISLIIAVSENNTIGRNGRLPWDISEDKRRFKKLTTGHHVVVGRKTFDSIGKLLSHRTLVVVTGNPDFPDIRPFEKGPDAALLAASSVREALDLCHRRGETEAFIAGGGEIYRQTLSMAHRIYMTRIHATYEGDVTFPELGDEWKVIKRERSRDGRCSYLLYVRSSGG
jgi:dihydrofolate reductase